MVVLSEPGRSPPKGGGWFCLSAAAWWRVSPRKGFGRTSSRALSAASARTKAAPLATPSASDHLDVAIVVL